MKQFFVYLIISIIALFYSCDSASITSVNPSSTTTTTTTVKPVTTRSLTFTVPDWTWNGNVKVFVCFWDGVNPSQWTACSGSSTTVTCTIPNDSTGCLIVRCPNGTTNPDWAIEGDNPGRIYNKTEDIVLTDATSYTVEFVEHNPGE